MSTATICAFCLRGQHAKCSLPDTCTCVKCYPPPEGPVVCEDPPPRGRKPEPALTDEQVELLKGSPNQWARVATFDSKGKAASVAGSKYRKQQFPDNEWEFTARIKGKTQSQLYARFIGEHP